MNFFIINISKNLFETKYKITISANLKEKAPVIIFSIFNVTSYILI